MITVNTKNTKLAKESTQYDKYDARAAEFDNYVGKRLEKELGLSNVYIEPSVQAGHGRLFIFYDNCKGNVPSVDFETADEFIYKNDREGYYNYILSAINAKNTN